MDKRAAVIAALVLAACGGAATPSPVPTTPPVAPGALRAPADFAKIPDKAARSRALFTEATRVMLHPRCKNCHPAGDSPMQGEANAIIVHDPPVQRGDTNEGLPGLRCDGCHQDQNLELARVPGAPKWHLAPREMAWTDKTPHTLCEQIKDPARNGKKSLAEIVEHSGHDPLVAWGWAPGHGREPAPGTQAQFGALMDAWVKEGAVCP